MVALTLMPLSHHDPADRRATRLAPHRSASTSLCYPEGAPATEGSHAPEHVSMRSLTAGCCRDGMLSAVRDDRRSLVSSLSERSGCPGETVRPCARTGDAFVVGSSSTVSAGSGRGG